MFEMTHCSYNKIDQDRFSVSRPHGSDDYIFLHFSFPVRIRVYDRTFRAKPDSCVLFSPHTPHYYESVSLSELQGSFFYFRASEDFLEPFSFPRNEPFSVPDPPIVEEYLMRLFSCVVEQSPLQTVEETATVQLLFSYLAKCMTAMERLPLYEQTNFLNHIRLTVFTNVATDWDAESIAKLSNLSVPQFYKLYKKIYGISPMEDLNRYRIESAKRLLVSGYSVNDIAGMIGMNSSHYFSEFFKKRVGCTPTQFKKARR